MSERDDFIKAHKEFEEALKFAQRILGVVYGRKVEARRAWANILCFRLCSVGHSILTLCRLDLCQEEPVPTDFTALDHGSIAALTRTMLDTWLMFSHISEAEMSEEEWLRRKAALELHDVTARYRLLKGIGDGETEDAQEWKAKMRALRGILRSDPVFQSLDVKIRGDVLAGRSPYIYGKNAILKRADMDVAPFNAMFGVLSSQAHSAPVAFYRSNPNEPELGSTPDFQYITAGLAEIFPTEETKH